MLLRSGQMSSMRDDATPMFQPLDQRRAFEAIISQISAAIVEGRLRPGDRLPPERDLAETFGVSRPSVREALRALEVFGVLARRRGTGPDSGSTVAASAGEGLVNAMGFQAALLDISTRDIVDVRAVLEAFAAREAAASKADCTELRAALERLEGAKDLQAYYHADTEFHLAVARISGNALLPVLMEALRGVLERYMVSVLGTPSFWEAERPFLADEHRRIVECIESGDGEAAARTMRSHILDFYEQRAADGEVTS